MTVVPNTDEKNSKRRLKMWKKSAVDLFINSSKLKGRVRLVLAQPWSTTQGRRKRPADLVSLPLLFSYANRMSCLDTVHPGRLTSSFSQRPTRSSVAPVLVQTARTLWWPPWRVHYRPRHPQALKHRKVKDAPACLPHYHTDTHEHAHTRTHSCDATGMPQLTFVAVEHD